MQAARPVDEGGEAGGIDAPLREIAAIALAAGRSDRGLSVGEEHGKRSDSAIDQALEAAPLHAFDGEPQVDSLVEGGAGRIADRGGLEREDRRETGAAECVQGPPGTLLVDGRAAHREPCYGRRSSAPEGGWAPFARLSSATVDEVKWNHSRVIAAADSAGVGLRSATS